MESCSEGRGSPFVITQKGREKCDAGGGLLTFHRDLFLSRFSSASLLSARGYGRAVCVLGNKSGLEGSQVGTQEPPAFCLATETWRLSGL